MLKDKPTRFMVETKYSPRYAPQLEATKAQLASRFIGT